VKTGSTLRFCIFLLVRTSWPAIFRADHAGSIPVGRSLQIRSSEGWGVVGSGLVRGKTTPQTTNRPQLRNAAM
jgi:hypothetical protein